MKTEAFALRSGCLITVLAPLVGVILYPRAKWVFAFALAGLALLIIDSLLLKRVDPAPNVVADDAERLLKGTFSGWEVDDYEHLNPRDPRVRELWRRTIDVGGLPEEWVRLDESKKDELRDIIRTLRRLPAVEP